MLIYLQIKKVFTRKITHEGRLAAAWLVQATAGDCDIVELQGTVGSSAALDRQQGFNEVIALFPNMHIILSQSGDFTRTVGKEVMESFLRTVDPSEICAVWAHNDDMLIGAIQAMKEAGKQLVGSKDITQSQSTSTSSGLQDLSESASSIGKQGMKWAFTMMAINKAVQMFDRTVAELDIKLSKIVPSGPERCGSGEGCFL